MLFEGGEVLLRYRDRIAELQKLVNTATDEAPE
jgi:hypothetical protein